ncbi:MAG TPA: ABC transporter permease [Kofleriaceae bacterium]|nr:ABC transporter permease [Kofleriaceae bacterium]
MTAAIVRRLAWTVLVVWFVVTLTFLVIAAVPADPARALLGPHATEQTLGVVRAHYCLDRGLLVQYGCWLDHVVHFDLGESYRSKRAVTEILAARIGPTAQLALAAIVLQLVIGVPLGVLAAVRRGRWPDLAGNLVGLIGQSAPSFFLGTVLLYVFAYRFGWFPITGAGDGGLDRLVHLVLPAVTLSALGIAYYARLVRSELIDQLDQEYVRTARAKGLPERSVVGRHAMRHALGPLVALVGLDLGVLLGGAAVVEVIFGWPGLGREILQATLQLDIPLIVGVVLVAAIAIAVANLLVDLVQLWLDPRLRDP